MKKNKEKKTKPVTQSSAFEKIIPLKNLFSEKMLRNHLTTIQKYPVVEEISRKVKSGMKIVGNQAVEFGKKAQILARNTGVHIKIAQCHTRIKALYTAIGKEVYKQSTARKKGANNIPRYLKEIQTIEKEITYLEKTLT